MKPGDMVMVVGCPVEGFNGSIGSLVALTVERYEAVGAVKVASVKFPRPMPWPYPGLDPTRGYMDQAWLIVINDPPGQDETLTWCPVPQRIKETA